MIIFTIFFQFVNCLLDFFGFLKVYSSNHRNHQKRHLSIYSIIYIYTCRKNNRKRKSSSLDEVSKQSEGHDDATTQESDKIPSDSTDHTSTVTQKRRGRPRKRKNTLKHEANE